ncbi:MAG: GatB/YqeY domain-containing protein [Lachnospiraceae bacterium]|nr:GatB/YqeY domain-containing protein [Lachnospiraceae bacterium]
MSLKENLLQDMKEAMKNKDTIRKNTIQLVRGGVLQIEKDKKVELDDEGVLEVISKELKKRRDSLPDFEKSGRMDLVDDLNKEIEILLAYLPEQLSESEIKNIVEEAINEVGATTMKDMGKVMGAVTPKVKGRADNKIVSSLVKELLSK